MMNAKFLILDFINFVFLIFLIIVFFVYFILGDRIDMATNFMKMLLPFSFLGIIFLGKLKLFMTKIKKRINDGEDLNNIEFLLYVNLWDKIIGEVIAFLLPIIIIFLAYLNGEINNLDIIQAGLAFLVMLSWNAYLFNRAR